MHFVGNLQYSATKPITIKTRRSFNGCLDLRVFCYSALILVLSGCVGAAPRPDAAHSGHHHVSTQHPATPSMATAIASAPAASKKVLRTVNDMMQANELIVGACWDYLNEAFNRAGYPHNRRQTVFKGKYKGGKYADSNLIRPGDWLYYVNHSYHDVEHSGLFIGWTDQAQKEALIFSYAGEGRKNPARMRIYHLDQVYRIIRAKD